MITSLFSCHYFMQKGANKINIERSFPFLQILLTNIIDTMGAPSELIFVTPLHKMISAIDDWTRSAIDILHFEIISFPSLTTNAICTTGVPSEMILGQQLAPLPCQCTSSASAGVSAGGIYWPRSIHLQTNSIC